MKVILTEDVARLGRQSEVKEVPRGHALNFLIPRKLAIPATSENLKKHKAQISKKAEQKAEHDAEFKGAIKALEGQTVTYAATANEQGHLFSGVNVDTIVEALKTAGHNVDANTIKLENPIKEVGTFPIELEEGEQKGSFTLEIVAEK